ncbi:NAD(P)-dependent oxidoreductase [Pyruvatibacter sp.]|uniref:NAD-dependent epimerase/dehydratase family protein n=1 Tax=Pyruvatibacter sp. TaxID=1981328 RepID=UPI00326716D4
MRVAVTGTGGFAGSHIARHLRSVGMDVTAVVRRARADTLASLPHVDVQQADLASGITFSEPINALVHCAAEIPARCPDPDQLYAANVDAARNVFSAALDAGATHIIFCSSMSAFGTITADLVTPQTSVSDPDSYGRSKLAGETMLDEMVAARPEVGSVSLRLPGIVGPGSHDNFLSAAAGRMLAGDQINARNPDAPFNNILPVASLARFVEHLITHTLLGHTRLTLAAQNAAPIRQILAEIQAGAGTDVPVAFGSGGHSFLVSSKDACKLGYQPPDACQAARQFGQDCRDFKDL